MASDRESSPSAPTVTVIGVASVRVEPDEALLWLTLTALEEDPARAFSGVSARSNALIAMLDGLGVAKADRATAGVSVSEEFHHTSEGRRSLGHRATTRVIVRLTDQELIGRLAAQATAKLGAQLDGLRWRVAAENPAWLEAARLAAAHAERKARAYAEGVGAELGPLVRLAEPEGPEVMARRAAHQPLSAGAPEPMSIEPGEHDVAASIQATFSLKIN
jgi:uncharacterized protein YggE